MMILKLHYWTLVAPRMAFAAIRVLSAGHWYALASVVVMASAYSLGVASMASASVPMDPFPFLAGLSGTVTMGGAFRLVPLTLVTWVASLATIQLASLAMGGRGKFKHLSAMTGLAVAVTGYVTMVVGVAIVALEGTVGYLRWGSPFAGSPSVLVSPIIMAAIMAELLWFFMLYSLAARMTHNPRFPKCMYAGLGGILVHVTLFRYVIA
jgi:hypothetical protein